MTRRPHSSRRSRGFTLIELLMALAITTILLAGTLSAVMIAGKAIPSPTDAMSGTLAGAQVTEQIAGELETATLVLEQTPNAITFVVPPHKGDTLPERIRYSWSGVAGDPLLRQYNRAAAVVLIDHVYQFSITPVIATSTETYPGVTTEDATDSLVINDVAVAPAPLGNSNVNSNTSIGQYFAPPAFASGVIGWRPTRINFIGKQSDLLGSTSICVVQPDANMLPNGATCCQTTLAGTGLLSSYASQQVSVSNTGRLSTTSGICLTLTSLLGTPNSIIVQNNQGSGLLQAGNGGWAYKSNLQLQSQVYATLLRSGSSLSMTSKYLSAAGLSLRAGSAVNSAVQASAQSLNHPEMLSQYWEAKFDKDPTTLDVNADGTPDWALRGGGSLNVLGLVNLTWQANGSGLDTQPGDDFKHLTVIDLRCRATTGGSWAGATVNAARSGSTCAPIGAKVALQSDGTQTATVWRKTDDNTADILVTAPGLSTNPADIHLIIDPATGTVGISVNTVRYGTFTYNSFSSSDSSRSVSLTSSGSAEFDYVRVREVLP